MTCEFETFFSGFSYPILSYIIYFPEPETEHTRVPECTRVPEPICGVEVESGPARRIKGIA